MQKTIFIVNPETNNMSYPLPYLYLIFKAYYSEFGKYGDKWNWPLPIGNVDGYSFDDLVTRIVAESPDIVAFSSYLWNYQANLEIGKAVKTILPNTLIVYGGPEVVYEKSADWWQKNWWVDLVAGNDGNGEEFLRILLDQVYEGNLNPDQIPLCIYPNADRTDAIKATTKVDRTKFQWPSSMFKSSEVELQILKRIAEANGKRLTTVWETTRGCPYACSYCDWGGGTGTKILRKGSDIIDTELAQMENLNIEYIEFCDANFGILKDRDIDIVKRLIDKANRGWNVEIAFDGKTKHDIATANMIDKMLIESKIQYDFDYHFSVSASDAASAKAVNRSTFQTQKQLDFIAKIKDTGYRIRLELILGLPESTLESFYSEFNALAAADGWLTERFVWLMLGRSPAANPKYIEKYGIKTVAVKYPYLPAIRQDEREQYSVLHDPAYQGLFDVVVETSTYTRDEWIQMYFMDKFAGGLESCLVTDGVRRECEKHGMQASEFFKAVWQALQLMSGEAAIHRDKIFDSIRLALEGKSGIATYPYKGKTLILQLISVLFVADVREDFCLALLTTLPPTEEIMNSIFAMKNNLMEIHSSLDPFKEVADLYQDYAYSMAQAQKPEFAAVP
jgi:putative methyltransferase